jgi:signal transduction histidine kinase
MLENNKYDIVNIEEARTKKRDSNRKFSIPISSKIHNPNNKIEERINMLEHMMIELTEMFREASSDRVTNNGGNNGGGDDGMNGLEKRVDNLEHQNRRMQEQLEDVRSQTLLINSKLENTASKIDLLQFQNTITETIKESLKDLPSKNDVKVIFDEVITNKKLTTETKVENIVNGSNKSLIKWMIGTGIAVIGATVGIIRLFI